MKINWNEEIGIEITDEVKGLLEKAIKIAGNKSKLAKELDFNGNVIKTWLGIGSQIGKFIGWSHWRILRSFLKLHGLIDGSEPRWLTPTEMRKRLIESVETSTTLTHEEWKLITDYRLSSEETKENIRDMAARSAAKSKERLSASASMA